MSIIPENAIEVNLPFERDCFGCSPTNSHGLKLEFFYHEKIVYCPFKPKDHHVSWGNIVHGGVSAAICDESLGWLSMCALHSMAVTKDLMFDYLKPINLGDEMVIVSSIIKADKRFLIAESKMINQKEQICVKAKATMALVNAKTAKRLKIMSDSAIDEFSLFLENLKTHL
jgi:uncharacterized protein (TIGR00369 family)